MAEAKKPAPPGRDDPRKRSRVITMVCTAGHVDHGKTSLVKLLTGCETDRLKAEKERGLTIEVGFAPCYLGDELTAGISDVPGHEKFIKNMVAGVSGTDLAVLVVAADDGVMPQTVEHLQIMQILGVRDGLVALTKIDLVDPSRVEEVKEQVRRLARGTFLEGAPILPVSSRTGEGYFEFYKALVEKIRGAEIHRGKGVFRMPVDRVFTSPGTGMVILGIPLDGTIRVGDEVEVVPGGARGRIRDMEQFARKTEEGGCGQCLALVIPDLAKTPPRRGDMICLPGYVEPARTLHGRIRILPGLDPPLRHGESVRFHAGRVDAPARVFLLEKKTLAAGEEGLVTVALEEEAAVSPGDPFLLRRPSPSRTAGGGKILLVAPLSGSKFKRKELPSLLQKKIQFLEGADPFSPEGISRRVEWELLQAGEKALTLEELSRKSLFPPQVTREALRPLVEAGKVLDLEGKAFLHALGFEACRERLVKRLERLQEEKGALSGEQAALFQGFPWRPALQKRLMELLEKEGLARFQGGKVVFPKALGALPPEERELRERILALYRERPFQTPRPEELPELLGVPPSRTAPILEALVHGKELVRLTKNVILTPEALREAQAKAVRVIQEKGFLDSSKFKHEIGSTRKYALAILDYLDERHVTVRGMKNMRKLAVDYEKRLF